MLGEVPPWYKNKKPAAEPGPRMGNVRLYGNQYGTLLTGKGATFHFGEEYRKGEKAHRPTFESVYLKSITPDGAVIISRYESDGSRQYVSQNPDGKINYSRLDLGDLELEKGELDEYSFIVTEGGIMEILVVGWGDIPEIVVPMLPYESLLVDEFDEMVVRAA
jgi:hypothetical protein